MARLFLMVLVVILINNVMKIRSDDVDEPCEENIQTSPSKPIATVDNPCGNVPSTTAFKRKNGYWCSRMWIKAPNSLGVFEYQDALQDCEWAGLKPSSLESEEEYRYYRNVALHALYNMTAVWVAADYNLSTKQWYWNDGQAVSTMSPQPMNTDPDGRVAWVVNKDLNAPGFGSLQILDVKGTGSVRVNAHICGAPGFQFD